jgi:hypothetical protein
MLISSISSTIGSTQNVLANVLGTVSQRWNQSRSAMPATGVTVASLMDIDATDVAQL